eukprot:m.372899 g.372899  ORF g.372899 m.372899 type:complete len:482 (-) comp19995_c21_seq3:94-1539(-)
MIDNLRSASPFNKQGNLLALKVTPYIIMMASLSLLLALLPAVVVAVPTTAMRTTTRYPKTTTTTRPRHTTTAMRTTTTMYKTTIPPATRSCESEGLNPYDANGSCHSYWDRRSYGATAQPAGEIGFPYGGCCAVDFNTNPFRVFDCCSWSRPLPPQTKTTPVTTTTTASGYLPLPVDTCEAEGFNATDVSGSCFTWCAAIGTRSSLLPSDDSNPYGNGGCCCVDRQSDPNQPIYRQCCDFAQPTTKPTPTPSTKPIFTGTCPDAVTSPGEACYSWVTAQKFLYAPPIPPGEEPQYLYGGCCFTIPSQGTVEHCCAVATPATPTPVGKCSDWSIHGILDEAACSEFCTTRRVNFAWTPAGEDKEAPFGQCCCGLPGDGGKPSIHDGTCCNVVKPDDENPKDCTYDISRDCRVAIGLSAQQCNGCVGIDDDDDDHPNNCVACITNNLLDKNLVKNLKDPVRQCCPCIYQYADASKLDWMKIEC